MSILGRLALLFVVVPLVELALLIQVGSWVGIWPTVALVFLTGILGATLARSEGLRTLWAFRRETASGKLPGQPLLDGLCILVGGALLLTPGFVTDVAGFSLLLPPSRRLLQKGMRRRLRKMIEEGSVQVMSRSDVFGGVFGGGFDDEFEGGVGRRGSDDDRSSGSAPGGWPPEGWSGPRDDEESGKGSNAPDLDPDKEISQ